MARTNELLRTRHLLTSLGILVLLSGTGFGVMGFASADPEAIVADEFTFVLPMEGDHAVYDLTVVGVEPRNWKDGREPEQVEVIIGPDAIIRGADGIKQWTNTLQVFEDWSEPDAATIPEGFPANAFSDDRDDTFHLIPGTSTAVSYTYFRDRSDNRDGQVLTVSSAQQNLDIRDENAVPCGTMTALQGMTVKLVKVDIEETHTCRGTDVRIGAGDKLTITAAGELDGVRHVLVHADSSYDGHMRYWYQEGIPFPVRVEEYDMVGHYLTWEMTEFLRGEQEILREPFIIDDGSAVPGLVMAPRTDWGIDTAAVDHTFPPDEAWTRAMDDPDFPDLRDFLADHPNAQVYEAHYQNMRSDDMTRDGDSDSWSFRLTSDAKLLDVDVRRIIREEPVNDDDEDMGLPENLTGPDTEPEPQYQRVTEYLLGANELPQDPYAPRPADLPEEAPTWASLLDAWGAYNKDGSDQGNFLFFMYVCSTEECEQVELIASAGFAEYRRTYDGGDDPLDDYQEDFLEWRDVPDRDDIGLDAPFIYYQTKQSWRPAGLTDLLPTSASIQQSTAPVPVGPVWEMPPLRTAFAIGLLGVAAATIHFVSPLFKSGAVGLFSRIRNDQVLDHPMRQQLADLIAADPGVHHQELVRRTGAGKGAIEMHLDRLEKAQIIDAVRSDGYTCYFPHGRVDHRIMSMAPALKSETAQAILALAKKTPHIAMARLREDLGIAPSTLHYHIQRLVKAGVLEVTREGNSKVVDVTALGRKAQAA